MQNYIDVLKKKSYAKVIFLNEAMKEFLEQTKQIDSDKNLGEVNSD